MGEDDVAAQEKESICLKTYCFDLKKNPDLIGQIKSTTGLKFYSVGTYVENNKSYSTEIPFGENKSILFIPEKNVVIENQSRGDVRLRFGKGIIDFLVLNKFLIMMR